jgi:hypothetical protein
MSQLSSTDGLAASQPGRTGFRFAEVALAVWNIENVMVNVLNCCTVGRTLFDNLPHPRWHFRCVEDR